MYTKHALRELGVNTDTLTVDQIRQFNDMG